MRLGGKSDRPCSATDDARRINDGPCAGAGHRFVRIDDKRTVELDVHTLPAQRCHRWPLRLNAPLLARVPVPFPLMPGSEIVATPFKYCEVDAIVIAK